MKKADPNPVRHEKLKIIYHVNKVCFVETKKEYDRMNCYVLMLSNKTHSIKGVTRFSYCLN